MTTNTNTTQTRQIDSTNMNSNDESNQSDTDYVEIDLTPDTTPFGHIRCPREGCERTVPTKRGLPSHYGQCHKGESLIIDLVGKEPWIAYLEQEHVEHRRTARDIASNLPYLVKYDTVMADLKRFGLYERFRESNAPALDILEREDITTIEEAQAVSRELREEGGA